MTLETTRDNFYINRIIEQKKDSFFVENDAVIPDVKPDILNTINTSGIICIYKKEIQDGKIKIDGAINVNLMYFSDSDSGNIRSITTILDFNKVLDIQNVKKEMNLDINLNLENLECKIVNERKVSLKATISYDLKIFLKENIDIIKSVDKINDIQTLNNYYKISTFVGEGITKAYAKDTLNIDSTEKISEILKTDITIVNKETKLSYNKVLLKAEIRAKLLYLTEDNDIKTIERTIPVMGFVDIKDIKDDNLCYANYEIKNLLIKPNDSNENSIYIEIEIEMSCRVYEEKSVNIIQDLYSPTLNLKYSSKKINIINKKNCIKDICNIREKQVIEEIKTNKIYDIDINPLILKQNILNDKIMYEGELWINIFYKSNITDGIDIKKTNIPFNFEMKLNENISDTNINTSIEIGMNDFVIMPDESIEIKADLIFLVEYSNNIDVNIINNIESNDDQLDPRYSMTIYFTKQNDNLWEIAKKFKSTVEEISKINGIEKNQEIIAGKQLFIPKYISL